MPHSGSATIAGNEKGKIEAGRLGRLRVAERASTSSNMMMASALFRGFGPALLCFCRRNQQLRLIALDRDDQPDIEIVVRASG